MGQMAPKSMQEANGQPRKSKKAPQPSQNQRTKGGINTFLQHPQPTTAKSRQASKNTLSFFVS
jgi:hypothetical protein